MLRCARHALHCRSRPFHRRHTAAERSRSARSGPRDGRARPRLAHTGNTHALADEEFKSAKCFGELTTGNASIATRRKVTPGRSVRSTRFRRRATSFRRESRWQRGRTPLCFRRGVDASLGAAAALEDRRDTRSVLAAFDEQLDRARKDRSTPRIRTSVLPTTSHRYRRVDDFTNTSYHRLVSRVCKGVPVGTCNTAIPFSVKDYRHAEFPTRSR